MQENPAVIKERFRKEMKEKFKKINIVNQIESDSESIDMTEFFDNNQMCSTSEELRPDKPESGPSD